MADISVDDEVQKNTMEVALMVDPYGEDKPGGLGRAILEMAKGITADRGNEYIVYLKNPPKNPTPFGKEVRVESLDVSQLWFAPGKKLSRRSDLYIFFTPIIPLTFFPKKSVVVAHDFAYLELPAQNVKGKISRLILKQLHKISLMKATTIVAVSETAKGAIISHFGIGSEKIHVIYNGFIALGQVPEPIVMPEKFFLFAGVLKERKNVLGVIHAFAEFAQNDETYSLVIAGKMGGTYAREAERLADDLNTGNRVRFLGYVTDAQLYYLYTKATALVFPSFVEGFGMPVLEAMDAGLPVITSNYGALAEVAGDAALLINPHDPSDIARAMNRFARDEALRAEYSSRGKTRAAQFSWEKNAREFSALIKET